MYLAHAATKCTGLIAEPPHPVNWNLLTAEEAEAEWAELDRWVTWLRHATPVSTSTHSTSLVALTPVMEPIQTPDVAGHARFPLGNKAVRAMADDPTTVRPLSVMTLASGSTGVVVSLPEHSSQRGSRRDQLDGCLMTGSNLTT